MKKKVLFVSRDNTLLKVSKGNHRADSLDRLELMPRMITSLLQIREKLDYELVMVTNQEGLGTAIYPEGIFWRIQNKLLQLLENEGLTFDAIFIDRSFEKENLPTRKPNIGMLSSYTKECYNFEKSYLVGESKDDMELANNLGIKAICFDGESHSCSRNATSWSEVVQLLKEERKSKINIKNEFATLKISLNLDKEKLPKPTINSSNPFFNLLFQKITDVIDCELQIKIGEGLFVDGHYTLKYIAEGFGKAFTEALEQGEFKQKTGFCIFPQEDALVETSLNFGDIPHLKWEVAFKRPYIGNMPTELFQSFFRTFAQAANCTLHIKATGENEHDMLEAIFTSFAKSLKMVCDV